MGLYETLIDEIFPINIYADSHYEVKLTCNEKIYLSMLDKCKDIRKVDTVMLHDITKQGLHKIKTHLIALKLLSPNTDAAITSEQAKSLTIQNCNKGFKCEWCGQESFVLQKHHYPILAKDGGTETVDICPNCHYTYHYILNGGFCYER